MRKFLKGDITMMLFPDSYPEKACQSYLASDSGGKVGVEERPCAENWRWEYDEHMA